MRSPALLALVGALAFSPAEAQAQDELVSVATVHLADGTSVALVEWRVTYEFATWKQKEPVSSARAQTRASAALVIGKKSYPLKSETLTLNHVEADGAVRVVSLNLKRAGDLKLEQPAREALAPELDKNVFYQPRSFDISGKTLSGIERSFCIGSLSPLVECGGTRSTRVTRIDFN